MDFGLGVKDMVQNGQNMVQRIIFGVRSESVLSGVENFMNTFILWHRTE